MANENTIQKDVYTSLLPAGKKDRCFGTIDLMAIQICFGIAAWFFLTGAQTGMLLPAREAIPTILMGNCLPIFMTAVIGIASARLGIEQMTISAGVFGQKGSILMLIFFMFACYPALAVSTLMFGQNATKFINIFNGPEFLSVENPGSTIFAVVALIIGTYIAFLGPRTLKWWTRISSAFIMLLLFGLVIYLFSYHGVQAIFDAQPAEPYTDADTGGLGEAWSKATALEVNVGLGFSWGFFFGQWTRLAKTESSGYHGCMWGWGVLSAVAGLFSAFAALAIQTYDPTMWIVKISEEVDFNLLAIVGLTLMGVANITAVPILVYPAAISVKSRFPKLGWIIALLIASVPTLPLLHPQVYYMISTVYSFIGLLTGIYGAIVVSDYFFITKGRFRMREFFSVKKGYQFAKGWNPGALVAIAVGFIVYLSILNPLTWSSPTGLFPYITAGLPTFFATGITYIICMKTWVLKKYVIPFVNDHDEVTK